jgi:hypothetical protein
MSEKIDWLAEMHKIAEERKGAVTAKDEAHIREMMKIPNDDVSVEDVEFKRYRSHF